ncbi:MAG TPA: hypothetical protein VMW17_04950 [Candidatus Binatia bacterium]|nr:hypothetical protein [Candidatus Binatia bacterium]
MERLPVFILGALLVVSLAGQANATPLTALRYTPDIPIAIAGVTVEPSNVADDNLAGTVNLVDVGPIPTEAHIDAYQELVFGAHLLSFDVPVSLPGNVVAMPADVVQYGSGSYQIVFNAAAHGVPAEVNTDAVGSFGNSLLLSFDTPVTLGSLRIEPRDVAQFDGTSFSLFFSGSAAGVPSELNLDGIAALANGHVLVSFDGSGTIGAVNFDDEDLLEYDPTAHTWQLAYDGSVQYPAWGPANLQAFSAQVAAQPPTSESTSQTVGAGGTVTTDPSNTGATITNVMTTAVTTPNGGTVSIVETALGVSVPPAFTLLGQAVTVSAPRATAAAPLVIVLRLDASIIPAGATPDMVQVLKDGTQVPICLTNDGTANPDPCVAARTQLGDGDVSITVRSSSAATFTPVLPIATDGGAPYASGSFRVESNGVTTCLEFTFDDLTYQVFGTPINLGTSVGHMYCTVQNGPNSSAGRCESWPDASLLVVDGGTSRSVCPPSGCLSGDEISFTTSGATGTGSVASLIDADEFTTEGSYHFTGFTSQPSIRGASSVPGCPLSGTVATFIGRAGSNAFRNVATPAGSDVTVSTTATYFDATTGLIVPTTVDIAFSNVSSPGQTKMTTVTNPAGSLTSNFAVSVGGYHAAFLDISTDAQFSGPIQVCSRYPDADNDGLIDGTTVLETQLAFLHAEGDPPTFVDRTTSRDTSANIICGTVSHFSEFVVAVQQPGVPALDFTPAAAGKKDATSLKCQTTIGSSVKNFAGKKLQLLRGCFDAITDYQAQKLAGVSAAGQASALAAVNKSCAGTGVTSIERTPLGKIAGARVDTIGAIEQVCSTPPGTTLNGKPISKTASKDLTRDAITRYLDYVGCTLESALAQAYRDATGHLADFTAPDPSNPNTTTSLDQLLPCMRSIPANLILPPLDFTPPTTGKKDSASITCQKAIGSHAETFAVNSYGFVRACLEKIQTYNAIVDANGTAADVSKAHAAAVAQCVEAKPSDPDSKTMLGKIAAERTKAVAAIEQACGSPSTTDVSGKLIGAHASKDLTRDEIVSEMTARACIVDGVVGGGYPDAKSDLAQFQARPSQDPEGQNVAKTLDIFFNCLPNPR